MITKIRLLVLVSIALGLTGTPLAGVTTTCEPEPTDMSISYGDFINCEVEIAGDTDIYRAHFNVQDGVRIELTDTGITAVRLQVFDPAGNEIYDTATGSVAIYEDIISTAGIYTLVARGYSTLSDIGAYSLYLTCIGGPCLPVIPPKVTTGGGVSLSGAYVNLDITNGTAPPPSHCQDDSHYGRSVYDDVNSNLYICGQSGWTSH